MSANTNTSLGTATHISRMKASCMSVAARTWHISSNMQPKAISEGNAKSNVRNMPVCVRVKFHQIYRSGRMSSSSNRMKNRNNVK